LTYSGRFTHISGHPSATGLVHNRESLPAKGWRFTAVLLNQPRVDLGFIDQTVYNRVIIFTHFTGRLSQHSQMMDTCFSCSLLCCLFCVADSKGADITIFD